MLMNSNAGYGSINRYSQEIIDTFMKKQGTNFKVKLYLNNLFYI